MKESFLTELARPQPNPGGGAAAAYGAGVALALLTKVVKLELGRSRHSDSDKSFWEERLSQVRRLEEDLKQLRDADVRAYMNLARARRKEGWSLAEALEEAIDCPRRIMAAALQGLREVVAAGEKCRSHLIADLHVAGEFLGAALRGAHYIAAANLPLLALGELRREHAARLKELLEQADLTLREVRKLLSDRGSAPGGR
ncbi:MAG: cyclodeaminase/cyclohydrolase family protein [Deltaproteobacteria bacterium]|nr:cyclodeaminase/cyclohydrolase family protein [Deltaproteobacteria bacterium]